MVGLAVRLAERRPARSRSSRCARCRVRGPRIPTPCLSCARGALQRTMPLRPLASRCEGASAPSPPLAAGSRASRQRRRQQSSAAQEEEEEEEEVAGRAQRERSVIGTLSRASPRATAHVECGLAHGAAVAAPPWRLRAWSPSTHEQKERRLFEPLSSPALQNQLQVFAGPVRQKTVSVSARK